MGRIEPREKPNSSIWQYAFDQFYTPDDSDDKVAIEKKPDLPDNKAEDTVISKKDKDAHILQSEVSETKTSRHSLARDQAIIPVLDRPQDLAPHVLEKGLADLAETLNEARSKQLDELSGEDLLFCAVNSPLLFLLQSANFSQFLEVKKIHLAIEKAFSEKNENARLAQIEKQHKDLENIGMVERINQGLTTFGLVASGVGGLLAGQYVLGTAAVLCGTLFAVDQVLDDVTKKTVISWIYKGAEKDQKFVSEQVSFFCGISSYLLSIGLQGPMVATIAMKITDIILTSVRGGLEHKHNLGQAVFIELNHACDKSRHKIETIINSTQRCMDTVFQFYENLSHVQKRRSKVISFLNQNI